LPIDAEEVRRIAELAHLELDDSEVDRQCRQLERILEYVAIIGEVAAAPPPPADHLSTGRRSPRPDIPCSSISQEAALSNAPQTESGLFRLPRVLDDG
jgi:aspartyl-tRNA(Asn)/glutamyl-tRNA(Gln) amidotransferase subunit C